MNDFKRGLKVEVDKRKEAKIDNQKGNLNKPSDKPRTIEEIMRKLNEEVWDK